MIRKKLQVVFIVWVLIAQNMEPAETRRGGQADTDDGGVDDSRIVYEFIERKPNLSIKPLKKIEFIEVPKNWDKNTIAPEWIIKRMSVLQAAVVTLRKAYAKILKEHAEWSCQWMQVHFPEFFACVTTNYINLVKDDYKEYPKGLLMTIKTHKELYIKSNVRKIPLYKLSKTTWRRTEFAVNGILSSIEEHRKQLEDLVIQKLNYDNASIKVICQIPSGDRHPVDNTTAPDPAYVFDEDYSPVAYNRL